MSNLLWHRRVNKKAHTVALKRENSCFNPFSRDSREVRAVSHARNPFCTHPIRVSRDPRGRSISTALYSTPADSTEGHGSR